MKNLKINQQTISALLSATLYLGAISGTFIYYQYESAKQVYITDIDNSNIFKGEDGKFYYYFAVGEHIITISRNDAHYYKCEEVEGYVIKEVEINGWRDNNKTTYVNTVPVIVEATKEKNGQFEFSCFGVIYTEKNNGNDNLLHANKNRLVLTKKQTSLRNTGNK